MKILLAIDGSIHSDNAVDEISSQPWPENSECIVVTVAEPLHNKADAAFLGFGKMALEAQEALDADIHKILAETTDKLTERFGKGKVSGTFCEGKAIDKILETARNLKPDLIVMGSHGNSGYNDQSFGSVVTTVANHAPCSVRIVHYMPTFSLEKKQKEKLPMEEARYLVAINESDNSKALVEMIVSSPWPEESIFQLISVVSEPKSVFHSRFFKDAKIDNANAERYKLQKAAMEKLVKESAAKVEANGKKGKVSYHVLEGNVRSLILQVAQDWPADMIILGAHDRDKSVLEHFLGSVAQAVLNNAECSVEIVRQKK